MNFDESLYRENESFEGPSKDVSLVECFVEEGASVERGGSGEDEGNSIGEKSQVGMKVQRELSKARQDLLWGQCSRSRM